MKPLSLILSLTILTEAISEALFDESLKTWSKFIQVLMFAAYFLFALQGYKIGVLALTSNMRWFYSSIALWIFYRGLLFNTAYNLVRGLPYNFMGTTSIIDRVFGIIFGGNLWMWIVFQVVCVVFIYLITWKRI